MFGRPSILRNLFLSFMAFGIAMGAVFPVYAQFFVDYRPGMKGWFVVGCLVAGIVLGISNYLLTKLVLLRRLARIAQVSKLISEGDVRHRCEMQSHDLIGLIIQSFNTMAGNLRDMIAAIGAATGRLAEHAGSLSEITDSTLQGARAQLEAAGRMQLHAQDVADSAGRVSHMAASVAQNSQAAQQGVTRGCDVVHDAIDRLEALARTVGESAEVIGALKSKSDAISRVTVVINEIAEQTNLLALNAAIESARAGEAGRGFAVVAEEVRTLSRRTQDATREIRGMIGSLHAETDRAFGVVTGGQRQAAESVQRAQAAERSLHAIVEEIAGIEGLNREIANSVQTYAALSDQILGAVGAVSEISDATAARAGRAAQESRQVEAIAGELRERVSRFKT